MYIDTCIYVYIHTYIEDRPCDSASQMKPTYLIHYDLSLNPLTPISISHSKKWL